MSSVTTQYSNDAFTTITDISLTAVATTINVTDDTNFPAVASPNYFYATLEDTAGKIEIVKVTTHVSASNQFTVERGQDNTAATTWASGDYIEMRPNSGVFEELRDHNHDTDYSDITHLHTGTYLPLTGGVLTGHVEGVTPAADEHLTRKDYVDQLNFIDIPGYHVGVILGSANVITFKTVRAYTLTQDQPLAVGGCEVAPSGGNPSFPIRRDGSIVGYLNFTSGSTALTSVTMASAVAFTAGQVLKVDAPSSTFGIQGVHFTLHGEFNF